MISIIKKVYMRMKKKNEKEKTGVFEVIAYTITPLKYIIIVKYAG